MALATQCPHCHTTFRVAHDQLKLRAGLVRCGACKEIFNGIEHLLRPEALRPATGNDASPRPSPASIPSSPAVESRAALLDSATGPATAERKPPAEPAARALEDAGSETQPAEPEEASGYSDFFEFLTPAPAVQPMAADIPGPIAEGDALPAETAAEPPAEPAAGPVTEAPADDPLTRMTLMDFRLRDDDDAIDDPLGIAQAAPVGQPDQPDPIDQAIEDLQRKPHRRAMRGSEEEERIEPAEADGAADEADEPSFVKKARRRQRFGQRITLLMAFGSILLLFAFAAQIAYAFRNQIAARFPEAKPTLVQVCALLGCRVGLPARIDALSIESNELQAATADGSTYLLFTLLRNRAATVQAWPNIELTLNDANDKPLARRVFTPREYLANIADVEKGFAAGSEQPVKLYFTLAQLKPAGYRVYVFYP